MTGPAHGTPSRYGYHGCHCEACRVGQAARAARLRADPSAAPHGTVNTYRNWDCRCESCKTAWAGYMKAARPGRGVLPLSYYLPEAAR